MTKVWSMAAYAMNKDSDSKSSNMTSFNQEIKIKVKEKNQKEEKKLSQSVASSSRDIDSSYETSPCWKNRFSTLNYTLKKTVINFDLSSSPEQSVLKKLPELTKSEDDLKFGSLKNIEESDDDVFLIDFVHSPLITKKVDFLTKSRLDNANKKNLKTDININIINNNNSINSNNSNNSNNNKYNCNYNSAKSKFETGLAKNVNTSNCLLSDRNESGKVSIQVPIILINQRKRSEKMYSLTSLINSSLPKLNISSNYFNNPANSVALITSWPFSVLNLILAKCWQTNKISRLAKREDNLLSHFHQNNQDNNTENPNSSTLESNIVLEPSTNGEVISITNHQINQNHSTSAIIERKIFNLPDIVKDTNGHWSSNHTGERRSASISLPVDEEILREIGCSLREISDQFDRVREKRNILSLTWDQTMNGINFFGCLIRRASQRDGRFCKKYRNERRQRSLSTNDTDLIEAGDSIF